MKLFTKVFTTFIVVFFSAMLLVGCGEELDLTDVGTTANSDVGAPASLIGKTVVMTVAQSSYVPSRPGAQINITQPGGTITYSLVSQNKIIGEGVLVIPTLYWDYTLNGNIGTLNMEMEYGTTTDTYTFTSSTGGTWRQSGRLVSGTTFSFSGTFTTSTYTGASSSTSTNNSTTTTVTSGTGQIAVWSSKSTLQTGSISVNIDNTYAGSLTQYYNSTPTCGDYGTITKTVSTGTHFVSAVDGTTTWPSDSISVVAGGCSTYELR